MSADSLIQLAQVKGVVELGDWHPVAMVFVWMLLLFLTGQVSSMMIIQLAGLWISMTLIGIVVYEATKIKQLSLLPLYAAATPMVIGISGVIWKDVQMAYALALAASVMLVTLNTAVADNILRKKILLAIAVILILYAALLRYNVLPAALPLLYLAVSSFSLRKSKFLHALIVAALIVGSVGLNALVSSVLGVKSQNPATAVMLDDIVNTKSHENLVSVDDSFQRDSLVAVQQECDKKDIEINSFWLCANAEQRKYIHDTNAEKTEDIWVESIFSNLPGYVLFRTETFAKFLLAPDPYVFHPGVDENKLGIEVSSTRLRDTLSIYVNDFGYRHFSFAFQGWFWLIAASVVFWYGIKKSTIYRKFIIALSVSAILYIFSYAPLAVAGDYRYIYWSVIAVTISVLLIITEIYISRQNKLKNRA